MLVSATVATIALLFAGGSSQASASAENEARLLDVETLRRLDFSDETKLKYTMPAVLAAAYSDGVNHRESYFGTRESRAKRKRTNPNRKHTRN